MADDNPDTSNMFAGIKKKKKKTVQIADLELDGEDQDTQKNSEPVAAKATKAAAAAQQDEDAVRPLESSADLTLKDEDPLDFSDLKKKKKKKAVAIDLDEVHVPSKSDSPNNVAAAAGAPKVDKMGNTIVADQVEEAKPEEAASGDVLEEFSGLKKKKKSKKSAFDLEAFEKELAAVEGGNVPTASGDASPAPAAGSDDEGAGDVDVPAPDGENPFGDEEGAGGEDGKSKAELAAEKKAWLSDPDRDYTYTELLGRFFSLLYSSHPSLSRGGAKKRYTIAPPNVQREGSKRTLFANIEDICKKMHRQPEHVIQFLFAELGTSGSVDGSKRLVIKGRFQQKQIENVLRRYIVEYVTCKTCKSPETLLTKDNRIFFVTCETCGLKRSVSSIKVGYQATTKRKKV